MVSKGTRRHRREAEGIRRELVCGGVVQLVRTPYSHPEQQDHERDFHSSRGARRCGNRCEWSADEVVSWLDRIAANRHPPATNKNAKHAMFSGRISGRGMRFVPETKGHAPTLRFPVSANRLLVRTRRASGLPNRRLRMQRTAVLAQLICLMT